MKIYNFFYLNAESLQSVKYHNKAVYALIIVCCLNLIPSTFAFFDLNYAIGSPPILTDTEEKKIKSNETVENNHKLPVEEKSPPPSETKKTLPPMAEKHIFSPEADGVIQTNNNGIIKNQDGQSSSNVEQNIDALMQKVKREIELTGIIITPSSKKAMILYKGKNAKNRQAAELYSEGSSIDEYMLKEVFSNYVVIAQNNLEVKIGLFHERTNRPEPQREIENKGNADKTAGIQEPELSQDMNPENNLEGNIPSAQSGVLPEKMLDSNAINSANNLPKEIENRNSQENSNPFVKAMQDGATPKETSNFSDETTNINNSLDGDMGANPFLQAIQRARERQKRQQ